MGLNSAVETEIRIIEKLGIIQPVFRIVGTEVPIKKDSILIIFRIIQEALHNVVKHAQATIVEVEINYSKESVSLFIKDNGVGIDQTIATEGSGLRNMRDRAKVIGANFELQSSKAGGTFISLSIPNS